MTAPRREDPAVEALAEGLSRVPLPQDSSGANTSWLNPFESAALAAAIARGEVPGVTLVADREPDGLRAAQADLGREQERNGQLLAELDALRAAVEALAIPEGSVRSGGDHSAAVAAAMEHIARRLRWPSLHWGTESVHADAWPHIAAAACRGIAEHLAAHPATDQPEVDRG